jgi:hypothetical protein
MNCHKEVIAFFSCYMMTLSPCLFSSSLSNVECWSSSVMAISNIRMRNFWKFILEEIWVRCTNLPNAVTYSVICCNISIRFLSSSNFHHLRFNWFTISECQKNRTNICILNIIEFCSIFFLFLYRQFMSLNETILVIFNWSKSHNSILSSIIHFLHVDINSWVRILLYPTI